MNVVLFGATGMVGQAVLRECLLNPEVDRVLSVGRNATGQQHPKLREIVHKDLFDLSPIATQLAGLDACFYCLGVTSAGMSEADYTRVTYDMTIAVAGALLQANPTRDGQGMTFVFVSGAGADSSEQSRVMWARVKGKAENAVQKIPFKAAYSVRPAMIVPMHGIQSRTTSYRILSLFLAPFFPLLKMAFPNYVTTTERMGRVMVKLAKQGSARKLLECADINELARV